MKSKNQSVIVSPFKGCNLEIKGTFNKAEPDVGIIAYFEIEEIIPLEKDIYQLLDWCNGSNIDYLFRLEELCVEACENDEPDYENE